MTDAPIGNSGFFDSSSISKLEQLSDEEFWNSARELAGITYQAPQHQEYLECVLASGSCLIPLAALHEVILPPHRLALLPATPEWMRGIVAWRSETIAVIDLDAYLSGNSDLIEPFSEGTLLVTDAGAGDVPVGLLVPTVGATTTISLDQLTTPTQAFAWYMPGRAKAIEGVQTETLVLDLDALLADVVQQIGMLSRDG
jgi:chemotaxis signal transduction protein